LSNKFGSTGLQYFNTYGGNPVSMAAANAVLDVLENEKLYLHVTDISNYLLNELNKLKDKFNIIGDIR
jgi:4-aminobutyrate aminotransferase-like enzyme